MEDGTDLFARFVDVLTDALDDHEATGEELARRVHLSRFHFDRLITAVSGEPPGTFRRRILLERAAHELATTRRTVLDVAVDAGYGSNEAFTRAFGRAFGSSPASWRRRPHSIQLDAPSGVHYHPPGRLRVPAREGVTSMDLLQKMVAHHVWLVGEMVDRTATLPDERLDEPITLSVEGIDDDPTLRWLLSRLIGQMGMWNASVAGREYDWSQEEHESVASMRQRLAVEGTAFRELVRAAVDEDRLDETFVDATCDPARLFTFGGMIAHVLTFAAHRRSLVVGALHDAGITDLGSGDPMEWVGDTAA